MHKTYTESVEAPRPDVSHILRDRARKKLPKHITDPAALDRIALVIASSPGPGLKKRPPARRAA